ncbi:MAG: ABC transporter ATP-binding protein [Anaerotardibacter sp.]
MAHGMPGPGPKRGPHGPRPHGPGGPHGFAGGEKAKDFKGTMLKLLKYLGVFKVSLVFVVIFAIGSTLFNIIGPKVLSEATTELFNGIVAKINGTGGINYDAIGFILLCALGLYLLSSLCSFVQSWLVSNVSQRTCYRMRQDIAEKINRMPYGYFEKSTIGDTLSRITNDVDTFGQSLNQGLVTLITSVTTLIGVLIMMLSINVPMTIIALLTIPLALILTKVVVSHSQKYFKQQQSTLGEINTIVEETFSGHALVRAYNQEDAVIEKFVETNNKLYNVGWRAQFLSGLMQPVMAFVGNLGYVAVAISGAFFATQGIITVGDIQAFIQYVKNFTQPLTQLAQVANTFQQMAAAIERIFEFLDEPEESKEIEKVDASLINGEVLFKDVSFGYEEDKVIIHNFNAHVEKGQTVALVGPTGAGKTTIVKLLMRFYDVNSGSIMLGGEDIRNFTRGQVRDSFCMVLQDTWLFKGTIRENIRYGRLDATDEEIEQAAKDAFAHHFITTLPGGYDFCINEDASNISQGQRQLLTIARAILANHSMMILDEATSSVDTLTEERIQRALDRLMENKTSFVIAHRLSTVRNADLILVIKDGDIVEQGNHQELLSKNGFYAELYNSQFDNCS